MPKQVHPIFEVDGIKFYRKPSGYYKSDYAKHGTMYMHRYVWERNYGPIPQGWHIHHRNGEKSDNRIENLEMLPCGEHVRGHLAEREPGWWVDGLAKARESAKQWHASDEGRKWHSENSVRSWVGRPLAEYQCLRCKKTYEKLVGTVKKAGRGFCSNYCKVAHRFASGVDNETRACCICGTEFVANKYIKKKTCSKACAGKAIANARKGVRPDSAP